MKLVMDERVKHRLIGLAVILSIGAIFAPAIMKKSNQRFDGNVSVAVQLPPKPFQPRVAMPEEQEMFAAAKVAHVELPAPMDTDEDIKTLAKAEPLSQMNDTQLPGAASIIAKTRLEPQTIIKQKTQPIAMKKKVIPRKVVKNAPPPKPKVISQHHKIVKAITQRMAKAKELPKGQYGVQLATFSKQHNAEVLLLKLRQKGYKATYNRVLTTEGAVYKVIVGQTSREQAQVLKKQLANSVQIRGFIVTTEVS